jgi:hypothetical protein
MLAVVVSDVEIDGEHRFVSFDGLSGKASVAQLITGVLWIWLNVGSLREYANHVSISDLDGSRESRTNRAVARTGLQVSFASPRK